MNFTRSFKGDVSLHGIPAGCCVLSPCRRSNLPPMFSVRTLRPDPFFFTFPLTRFQEPLREPSLTGAKGRVYAAQTPTIDAAASILFERGSAARRASHATLRGRETPAYIVVMERTHPLTSFSDDELLRRLSDLLGRSRRDEADLVAHIGEVDRRRLYAREASPSMFAYCTEVLHLSEAEAYLRIAAARAAREHPLLLTLLADGRLHLTAIAKLAPHLTPENREDILKRAAHRSKREIEELVAELAPRPGCSGGDAEAARPTGGDDVAGPPTRPGRRGACRTASGGRGFGRSATPAGRSGRARARTASGRSRGGRRRTASGRT